MTCVTNVMLCSQNVLQYQADTCSYLLDRHAQSSPCDTPCAHYHVMCIDTRLETGAD